MLFTTLSNKLPALAFKRWCTSDSCKRSSIKGCGNQTARETKTRIPFKCDLIQDCDLKSIINHQSGETDAEVLNILSKKSKLLDVCGQILGVQILRSKPSQASQP